MKKLVVFIEILCVFTFAIFYSRSVPRQGRGYYLNGHWHDNCLWDCRCAWQERSAKGVWYWRHDHSECFCEDHTGWFCCDKLNDI